jgi:hypothetical protein
VAKAELFEVIQDVVLIFKSVALNNQLKAGYNCSDLG